jgi:hypothetical protein
MQTTITRAEPLTDAECAALVEAAEYFEGLAEWARDVADRRSRAEARECAASRLGGACVGDYDRLVTLREVIR